MKLQDLSLQAKRGNPLRLPRRLRSPRNDRRGFTLIELLIVITITALVGTTGIVLTNRSLAHRELNTITQLIESEIRQAQTDAFAQKNDSSHSVVISTSSITRDGIITPIDAEVEISGTDEFVFEKGSLVPVTAGTLTITLGNQMADIELSTYGVLEITTGDVSP